MLVGFGFDPVAFILAVEGSEFPGEEGVHEDEGDHSVVHCDGGWKGIGCLASNLVSVKRVEGGSREPIHPGVFIPLRGGVEGGCEGQVEDEFGYYSPDQVGDSQVREDVTEAYFILGVPLGEEVWAYILFLMTSRG